MLNIAARHGDAQLAHDIISFLEERPGNTFDHSHYELLIAAYVNSSNLENALAILSVMQSVNVLPNGSTTRPVYQYLTESKDLPREAFAILRDLHSSGQPISVASVNCLIDAAIYFENLNLALDFYKSIHELCVSAKPNIETFNALLRGCRVCGDRKDIALILAAEMVALKIQPNALTYDRMLLICIRQKDDYEDGMKYFQEMQTHKMRARYGTLLAVVRRLTVEADARVDAVLEEMENVVDISMVMRLRKWVNMYWGNKSVDINRGNATFSINEGLEASSDESNNVTPDASHACSPNNMDNLPPTEENAAPSSPEKESDVPSQKEVFDSLSKERENFLDDTIISSGGMVNSPTAEEADISSKAEVDGPARIERGAYLSKDMDNVFDELGVNDKAELISEQRRRKELKK
jgi:hypothetical protein